MVGSVSVQPVCRHSQVAYWENEFVVAQRAEARRAAVPYSESLRAQVLKAVAAAYTLASMIETSPAMATEVHNRFDVIAGTLRVTYGGITNLQLAPCGIVSQISPLTGNEAAIGHNLLASPDRVNAALDTIVSRRLTFVGPLDLVQGGVAIIGRYPVFNKDMSNNCTFPVEGVPQTFWGYATMLTSVTDLLAGQHLSELEDAGYSWAITAPKWPGVVAGKLPPDSETIEINFEDGANFRFATWTLHIAPTAGWSPVSPTLPWKAASLALACVSAWLTSYTLLFRNLVLGHALLYIAEVMDPKAHAKLESSRRPSLGLLV
jgi:hypothetical protein